MKNVLFILSICMMQTILFAQHTAPERDLYFGISDYPETIHFQDTFFIHYSFYCIGDTLEETSYHFYPPDFEDFMVWQARATSSINNFNNGQDLIQAYRFQLIANQIGEFKIEPAYYIYGQDTFYAAPLILQVQEPILHFPE